MPSGPPPATPPPARGVTFGPVVTAPLPPSPIPGPPASPCDFYGQKGGRPEEPSKLVHSLPVLSVTEGNADASVVTGDWLARIGPIMRSMSPGAPLWWQKTLEVANGFYQQWLHADPLQRLGVKTEAIGYTWDQGTHALVEERAAVLLLQALPPEMQSEAVSIRALSSSALLFLLMSRFQPGGGSEKSMILSFLTQPTVEGSPGIVANHTALRKWERLYRRCKELGLQAPDPTLLVRALDSLARVINNKSPQAVFRLSTFRHTSHLDVVPNEGTVLQYAQLLVAELETLMLSLSEGKHQRVAALNGAQKGGEPQEGGGKGKPNLKGKPNGKAAVGDKEPCKFFSQPNGCRYGPHCVNYHPRLEPSDGRCFACGSSKHSQADCPRKEAPELNPRQKGKGGGKGQSAGEETSTTGQSSKKASSVAPVPNPKPKAAAVTVEGPSAPRVSALGTAALMGLLDGGATHALRSATEKEWSEARPISVHLATGQAQLKVNKLGTLLTLDPNQQPILPLGLAVEQLGLRVNWVGDLCRIVHPRRGRLKVHLRDGCPEIAYDLCLELIRELELSKSSAYVQALQGVRLASQTQLREVLTSQHDESWPKQVEGLKRWFQATYPDVPQRIAEMIFTLPEYAAECPFNRHIRKRLKRGGVLLHFCSGSQTWSHQSFAYTLNLDLEKGCDLNHSGVFLCLLEAAIHDGFDALLGGPPCRTLSRLRSLVGDNGPNVCRSRTGCERFGLEDLTAEQAFQVDLDTALIFQFMVLAEVMQAVKQIRGRKPGYVLAEHPADPATYVSARNSTLVESDVRDEYPSIWVWPEVEAWVARLSLHMVRCDQGALGGSAVKPTVLVTTSSWLWEQLHGVVVPLDQLWTVFRGDDLRSRIATSKSHAKWAPGMVQVIKESLTCWSKSEDPYEDDANRLKALRTLVGENLAPEEVGLASATDSSSEGDVPRVARASVGDKKEWISHCLRGHIPWRRDCLACVQSAAFQRPHRRQRHPKILNLCADLAGPYVRGEDSTIKHPKHLMIAVYAFPLFEVSSEEEPEEERGYDIPETWVDEEVQDEGSGVGGGVDPEEGDSEPVEASCKEKELLKKDQDKWDEIIKACKQKYRTVTLTFVEILPDKQASTVVSALSRVYCRLKSQGFPILGLHTDRGGEFVNKSVRVWAESRNLLRSTTQPEAPSSNGRCERALGLVKRGIRALLHAHGLAPTFWPHCARYVGESMLRAALKRIGQPVSPMKPFYAKAMIRARTWADTKWSSRALEGRIVSPSPEVSRGWILRAENKGQIFFYASTLIYTSLRDPEEPPQLEGKPDPKEFAEVIQPMNKVPSLPEDGLTVDASTLPEALGGTSKDDVSGFPSPKWAPPVRRVPSKSRGTLETGEQVESPVLDPGGPREPSGYAPEGGGQFPSAVEAAVPLPEDPVGPRRTRISGKTTVAALKQDVVRDDLVSALCLPTVNPRVCALRVPRSLPGGGGSSVFASSTEHSRADNALDCSCQDRDCQVCKLKFVSVGSLPSASDDDLVIAQASVCGRQLLEDHGEADPALRPSAVCQAVGNLDSDLPRCCSLEIPPEGDVVSERRWYHSLPEDPAECCDSEGEDLEPENRNGLEGAICSLDGERSRLLAVIRDEETALKHEIARGEGEGTVAALKASYNLLHEVEGQLVFLQDEQAGCLLPRVAVMSASDDQPEVTPEVLHTHAVALEEVLRDLESWKPSMKDELGSLLEAHNAISPITYDEVKKLEESGVNVLWVPSKIVATIKAGTGRKKIRLVACGNFLSREKTRKSPTLSRTDVFTSSLDSLSLRLQLAMASSRKWVLTSVDVKTAFLTAPIGGGRQLRTIVVKPARVLVEAGLVAPGQLFKVEKALYGLHQSPRDWSISRDTKLCALTWSVNGETRRLVQSKCDCSIWFIRRVVQDVVVTNEPPIGALGVYVDDLLLTSEESETDALLRAIRSLWTCSEEQRSTKGRVIFCGLEIDQNPETKELEIHQSSYIRALEARHGPLRSAVLPMFKDEDEEEETSLDMIREAQGLAGELTWISCRSRPDVSFSVSKIARMLSKRPSAAIKAAKQVIGYLLHTRAYCLRYGGPTDPELEGHLLRKRGMEVVETFTDASFGVESGRSQSGVVVAVGGCVVGWLSLTQPFTTLSTCESELIAACEGLTLTQALLPLWAEMLGSTPAWYAYTDSVACAAVLIYPSGNWRTKHLRLRSKVYQELVEAEELAIAHVPGRFQLADALTKPLTRVRMLELLKFAGMSNLDNEGGGQSSRTGAATPLLKVLLVGCLVGQAQAQPEYRLAGDMDSFLWFIFTVLVVVGGLIGLYLQDRRHQARLQELREMSAQALRELDQAVSKRESASGGATHEEVSLCPSKAPSIAKSPPVLSKAAPPKSQAASRSLRAVPVFGSGPCNAPPANRPDPLTSQVGRPPVPKMVQPDHPNPSGTFGLGPPALPVPKMVQPDHPNPSGTFGLGPPALPVPKMVQPDHPNPSGTFGLGPPALPVPKMVQPDHPNPSGTFGLGPPALPPVPKTVQPGHTNPLRPYGLGPEPATASGAAASNTTHDASGVVVSTLVGQHHGFLNPQAVVGFLESQIHQEMSAVNTPPLEDEDSLASSEDSLDTEESAHVGWHEPEFDFDPHDPYADLPSSERGRLDPDTYDPSHVNSEDFPATLRDVLSFEGLRILSSLGISPSAWGGWYATSQSFRWAVKYAHEDLVARMSRLHIFCGPSCSRYSRANDADNLPEDGLFFSEEDDWKLEIHDFFRGNDEYAFQNVERAYHFWQKIGGYTWQLDLDVVRDGLSMSEEHGLAMLAAGQPGASSRDLRSRPRFPTCLGFYVDDVAPDLTASSSQDMPMSDHDHAMAHAAFFLYQNNITVDWEQLSEAQQDIYHSLVGAWLQGIHEVD